MAGKTNSTKLQAVLEAEVSKGDKEKGLEAVARTVKKAKAAAASELSAMDIALDTQRDSVEAIERNPNSTLAQILQARRELQLAETNHKAAQAIMEERF